jgi:NitT/TauT family transport system permease protein
MSGRDPQRPGSGAGLRVVRRLRGAFGAQQITAFASVLAVLVVWQVLGPAQPLFASYPTAIAAAAWEIVPSDIIPAWQPTLVGFGLGLAISIPLAIITGVAMGRIKLVDTILSPYVNALYVTPRIALIPVLVLWFGLDFSLRLAIVVLSSVFPMIVNTYTGMKHVDRDLLDVGRVFTADARQRLFTIILPGSLPYIFAGLRIGTARALGGVIVAETTVGISGVGRRLVTYGAFFKTDKLFVTVISVGVVGLLIAGAVAWVQRHLASWTQAVRTR